MKTRYPLAMRLLHWLMALLILAMICVGTLMTSMSDESPAKYAVLYPYHKSFGMLLVALVLARMLVRRNSPVPPAPSALAPWERRLAKLGHQLLYALMLLVPLLGYCMSSTYTQSDGVNFFVVMLPELLPKNDSWFVWFQRLHSIAAYSLLALVILHVAGAVKHRLQHRGTEADVLPRMF